MTIRWRDELSIDNGQIDRDHRKLINIINRFEEEVTMGGLRSALENLHHYGIEHFVREEKIMIAEGFPDVASHRKEHADLTHQLSTIIELFNMSSFATDGPRIRSRTTDLLRKWLIDHIIRRDIALRDFLRQKRGAAPSPNDRSYHNRPRIEASDVKCFKQSPP